MPFSRSRSPESRTRSTTAWFARKAPVWRSIASTSVVLPWSTWATMARLRRSLRMAVARRRRWGTGGRISRWLGRPDCRHGTRAGPWLPAAVHSEHDCCRRDPVRDRRGRPGRHPGPASRAASRRSGLVGRCPAGDGRLARSGRRGGRGPCRERGRLRLPRPARSRTGRPDATGRGAGPGPGAGDATLPDLAGQDDLGRAGDDHLADRGARGTRMRCSARPGTARRAGQSSCPSFISMSCAGSRPTGCRRTSSRTLSLRSRRGRSRSATRESSTTSPPHRRICPRTRGRPSHWRPHPRMGRRRRRRGRPTRTVASAARGTCPVAVGTQRGAQSRAKAGARQARRRAARREFSSRPARPF